MIFLIYCIASLFYYVFVLSPPLRDNWPIFQILLQIMLDPWLSPEENLWGWLKRDFFCRLDTLPVLVIKHWHV